MEKIIILELIKKAKQTLKLFSDKNAEIENAFYLAVDGIRNNFSQMDRQRECLRK